MCTQAFLLASALLIPSFHAAPPVQPDASVFAPVGGPPRISVADKDKGEITKAEWAALKSVELHGCVPDARITALTICIKDCTNKAAFASGTDGTITNAMRTMIANLPAGTAFTVKVTVKDAKGKVWEVPDAHYVWKG
ncbi:MAG: hypothetical protein IPL52_11760 [Flavobacteriales bacterium]|nr:hypothetical protein [Flavobacteriales bacterium]